MSLFNKEKDLIQRIVNGILLLALITAIFFAFSNAVNLILGEDPNNNNCVSSEKDTTCEPDSYQVKYDNYQKIKSLCVSGFSIITFAGAMYLINKKED